MMSYYTAPWASNPSMEIIMSEDNIRVDFNTQTQYVREENKYIQISAS